MASDFSAYIRAIDEHIATALPHIPDDGWIRRSFGIVDTAARAEYFQPLIAPTRELVDLGGKRWRPLLLVLSARAQAEAMEKNQADVLSVAYQLAPLVEFIHTASLIHDDIEDRSDMRRGKASAYRTYGLDVAVNAASWLYFEAAASIETLNVPGHIKESLFALYTQETRRLHLGQAMDIRWHQADGMFPTVAEYLAMVRYKTGTLASLAARSGVLVAGGSEHTADTLGSIAADIGAGFQIIDDVINLTTGNPGKERGDDIVEGKRSLPVLLYTEKYGSASEFQAYFSQARTEGIRSDAVEKAIRVLQESGSIEAARARGSRFIQDGASRCQELFGQQNNAAADIAALFRRMIPYAR